MPSDRERYRSKASLKIFQNQNRFVKSFNKTRLQILITTTEAWQINRNCKEHKMKVQMDHSDSYLFRMDSVPAILKLGIFKILNAKNRHMNKIPILAFNHAMLSSTLTSTLFKLNNNKGQDTSHLNSTSSKGVEMISIQQTIQELSLRLFRFLLESWLEANQKSAIVHKSWSQNWNWHVVNLVNKF